MNERLLKQRAVTEKLLSEAALQIKGSAHFIEYSEFIGHNELGLALDTLTAAAKHCEVNTEYWRLLKKAAELMGLNEQVKELRRKFQLARASAVQPAVPPDAPAAASRRQGRG